MKPLLLLDTASMYYRAYHSLPETMVAKDGTPVNAIRGLIERIVKLQQDVKPRKIIAAWDTEWRPQWRVDLISSYKTHRTEINENLENIEDLSSIMPDSLAQQVPIIEDILNAFGIPVVGHADYEADDVIGTYSHTSKGPIQIVTGDRDLFQLIDDRKNISVLYTAKGEIQKYTESQVLTKYGIQAGQYVDFAILRGDPSDGLPGIKGIGEKTASKLIQDFENLDNLIDAAFENDERITPRIILNITESIDYLYAAKKVVPVARNVNIPDELELTFQTAPRSIIESLADQLNLRSTFLKAIHSFDINN
jgi:5'-3' exonuclease